MAHLINAIYDTSIPSAIIALQETHALIVERAIATQTQINVEPIAWGENFKRLEVFLPSGKALIGKSKEKFVEIVNILATLERTLAALEWLSTKYPACILRECHPSTSDDVGGNDIVLINIKGETLVRCEVTDVISSNAGQNNKEKNDLKKLECKNVVPDDSICRYIATSKEFANALSSPSRKWKTKHYRYARHETGLPNETVILEIKTRKQPGSESNCF